VHRDLPGQWACSMNRARVPYAHPHTRFLNSSFGRPSIKRFKRFALCYRTVVLSVCLSVCNVGVLWPNGRMDQNETWHEGRPQPRPHCVRWGPSTPQKEAQPPIFGPCPLWPNARWIKMPLGMDFGAFVGGDPVRVLRRSSASEN